MFAGQAGGLKHCKSSGMCLKTDRACNGKFKAFKLFQVQRFCLKEADGTRYSLAHVAINK